MKQCIAILLELRTYRWVKGTLNREQKCSWII